MLRNLLIICVFFLASNLFAAEWANKMFKQKSHNFGIVAKGAKAEHEFVLTNLYAQDVHIADVRTSCGCTTPTISKHWIKTGEKSSIIARFNTGSFTGSKGATLTVTIDEPIYAQVQLKVSGYIRTDVMLKPGSVNFGSVIVGTPVEKTITITHFNSSQWQIKDIETSSDYLSAQVKNRQSFSGGTVTYDLTVTLKENAPVGNLHHNLILSTNGKEKNVPVPVEGRISDVLTLSPAFLFLGVLEPGETITKTIVVRGQEAFSIESVWSDIPGISVASPDRELRESVYIVQVSFTAPRTPGKVTGSVSVKIEGREEPLSLEAQAVVKREEGA